MLLIHTQSSETPEVVNMLRRIKGVTSAGITFGPFDAVAQVEAVDLNIVGRIIVGEIRALPGVINTVTCLAVNSGN
jgi:DNA-binding Lrp family transcriptional regulator